MMYSGWSDQDIKEDLQDFTFTASDNGSDLPPKKKLPDCTRDISSDYKVWYAPPCTCSLRPMLSWGYLVDEAFGIVKEIKQMTEAVSAL